MSNVVSSTAPYMQKKAQEVVDRILEVNKANFEMDLYGRLIYEFTDSYFSALRDNSASFIPMTSGAYVVPPDENDQNPPIKFGFTVNLDAIALVGEDERYVNVEVPPALDVMSVVNEAIGKERCEQMYAELMKRGRAANVMVFAEALVKCVGGKIENGAMYDVPAVLAAVLATLGTCLSEEGHSMAPTMPKLVDGSVSWFYLYTDRLITVTFHSDAFIKAVTDFKERHERERAQFPGEDQAFLRVLTVAG